MASEISTYGKIEEEIKQILISELEVSPVILANSNSTTPLLGRGIGLDSIETLIYPNIAV